MFILYSALKRISLAVLCCFFCLGAAAQAGDACFPWSDKEKPVLADGKKTAPQPELQGEWRSVLDSSRLLTITSDTFSLKDQSGSMEGTLLESGPNLFFREKGGTGCIVLWQLLGDGRLSINSGEELFHRPTDPAIPTVTTRQYGSPDCRFTVSVPSRLPVEEIDDGVRISSMEKDASMLILSGKSKATAEKMAKDMCQQLSGHDFAAAGDDKNTYTFMATHNGTEIIQYVTKQDEQYLLITLMGYYPKLISYLKSVHIVSSDKN